MSDLLLNAVNNIQNPQTQIQPVKTQVESQPAKKTGMSDTNKIMLGLGGLATLAIAGIALRGKFKTKNIVKNTDGITQEAGQTINKTKENIEKKASDIFDAIKEKVTPHNEKLSPKESIQQWNKKLNEAPKEVINSEGRTNRLINNYQAQELTPHNYSEIPDCIISTRSYHNDFDVMKLQKDGVYRTTLSTSYSDKILPKTLSKSMIANEHHLVSGITDDGKAFVSFCVPNCRRDSAGRDLRDYVLLISENNKFTNAQEDAMKIFLGAENSLFARGKQTPLSTFIIDEGYSTHRTANDIDMNLDVLLSGIQTWSKNIKIDESKLALLKDVTPKKGNVVIRNSPNYVVDYLKTAAKDDANHVFIT